MNHELQTINFHDDSIFMVEHQGQPFTPLRPIVENIGLDWASQYTKLTSKRERWGVVMITTPSEGGNQEMLCIPLRKLAAFLYSIDADRVRSDLKAKVEMYQNECDEVLWNYWTNGVGLTDRKLAEFSLIPKVEHIALLEEINLLLRKQLVTAESKVATRANFTPDEDAQVIKLHKQGLSQREIGVAIGRKQGSIHSCLRRLKKNGIYVWEAKS